MKGFTTQTRNRKAIIKDLCKSTRLRPENILETVEQEQCFWHERYANKPASKAFTIEELLTAPVSEPRVGIGKFTSTANSHKKHQNLFSAFCGFWYLAMFTDNLGKKDFNFNVWTGDRFAFHPAECRNIIEGTHGTDTYHQWVKTVKDNFSTSSSWLVAEAKKAIPQWAAASVVCCDSSARLVAQVPDIEVRSGVAFFIY